MGHLLTLTRRASQTEKRKNALILNSRYTLYCKNRTLRPKEGAAREEMAAPISYANVHERKQEDKALRLVTLEGSVVLKIVKHCQESQPSLVTGQLLGLDIGSSLEVTDCYPFPVSLAVLKLTGANHWGKLS